SSCVSAFVSYLLRLLPRAALFPYTTLFRSRTRARAQWFRLSRGTLCGWACARLRLRGAGGSGGPMTTENVAVLFTDVVGSTELSDRKSTRLNSSHDQISYAVFCLKKKKNNK